MKFLLLTLLVAKVVTSQICNSQPGKSSILSISSENNQNNCYFLGRTTNPAIPCQGSSCQKCPNNNLAASVINAAGSWAGSEIWDPSHPKGLMTYEETTCQYTLVLNGLTPKTKYVWKVTQNEAWTNSFGCGNGDCEFTTNLSGSVKLFAKPTANKPELSSESIFFECGDGVCETGETCQVCPGDCGECPVTESTIATVPVVTSPLPVETGNPSIPCTLSNCPVCKNNLAQFVIRSTGSWTGKEVWDAAQPNGLMKWDQNICSYTLVITGIKNGPHTWKATGNGVWKHNWGCGNGDCEFTTSTGAIRFIVKVNGDSVVLSTDLNVAECGDGICETGESCSFCPGDCGECPPPFCGDGVCELPETFETCPSDCTNELPGCGVFNDEGCRGGSQFHANEGVDKRRWQTPKPGQKNYQPSFQDYHSLVGYGDIRYTSIARTEADVCIIATHRNADHVTMEYYFNDIAQTNMCKRFTTADKTEVSLKVKASDGTQLEIPAMTLLWNAQVLGSRNGGDYRGGQKGAVAEMFGWPHKDIEKECQILSKAGYLGIKLFPAHEQLMSTQPFNDIMNPWYFMYQPVSYKLDGRMGPREELQSLINKCRSQGVRVYNDLVLNHFTGAGNDLLNHRNPNAGCAKWGNKSSSAPVERQSPFYTHAYSYEFSANTGQAPSNENPGAGLGPQDFHCDRVLGSWSDLFILNNGWLVGLTDLDTSRETVRERQAAFVVEQMSMGMSGFRIDAAKHMSPEDISALLGKIQKKMGGQLPDDFFVWLEIITGGEANMIWRGPSWYNEQFNKALMKDLGGSQSEINKIKIWDGLYPKEPYNNPMDQYRVVIQNDDHDQQNPGSSSRDMDSMGCVLVKNCPVNQHRDFELKLFNNPNGVSDNDNNWPIRFILSSYYHTYGKDGVPDGLSSCDLCTVTCNTCKGSVPYMPAYEEGKCAYEGEGYTRTHRDVAVINAMRQWMKMGPISGGDIGLPGC